MITKDQYDIIDDKSRPGYVKVRLRSGLEAWAKIHVDDPEVESSYITPEQRKALGLMPKMRTKSWNEMTEDEKRLFTDYENDRE